MPKLTLRDLFAIVTVAAVLVAWWVDHRRMASSDAALVRDLRKFQIDVKSDESGNRTLISLLPPPPSIPLGLPAGILGPHVVPVGQQPEPIIPWTEGLKAHHGP